MQQPQSYSHLLFPNSQTTVAQGLVEAQGPINALASQVVTPSDKLTGDINKATKGLALANKGGNGVLAAAGLSPADVGLDAPLGASGTAAPATSTSSTTSSTASAGAPTNN